MIYFIIKCIIFKYVNFFNNCFKCYSFIWTTGMLMIIGFMYVFITPLFYDFEPGVLYSGNFLSFIGQVIPSVLFFILISDDEKIQDNIKTLVPYIAIISAVNSSNTVDNFILEMIFSIGYLVYQIGLYPWCFGLRLVNKMFGVAEGDYFKYDESGVNIIVEYISDFSGISIENVYSLFSCCFVVGLGLFLYENRPKALQIANQEAKVNYWYLDWIRLVVGIGVMLIPLTELLRLL